MLDVIEAPKMTYYVRTIDNLTGVHISEWASYETSIWYYGKCNSTFGSESEYVVEFDIWNNEPAFNAGNYAYKNADAVNCRLNVTLNTIENSDTLFKLAEPWFYCKCLTTDYKMQYRPVSNTSYFKEISGNVNPALVGTLQGNSDHTILQTKLIIPKNDVLSTETRYAFNIVFYYDYQN